MLAQEDKSFEKLEFNTGIVTQCYLDLTQDTCTFCQWVGYILEV